MDGLFRPRISLPSGIEGLLSAEELAAVLIHELTHARRRDNLIRLVHEIGVCVLWFHPLVWITGARLALYRELSCDESVIRRGRGRDLVSALAKLANPEQPLLLQASVSSFLSLRLARLATAPSQRGRAASGLLAVAFGAVVAMGVFQSRTYRLLFPGKALKERFVQPFSSRSRMALTVFTLLAAAGSSLSAQTQVRSRAEETLEWWNQIGGKLIAMTRDFPEDKYDFRVQKDERTFAENLLHVAAVDYDLGSRVSGAHMGPDFGKDIHNPSRAAYKTKADVVKVVESAVADCASVIKQQGDAGLDRTMQFGWETGRHVVHNSYVWITGIEHSTEHFGQLVVYYRANNLKPPESRR